VIAALQSAGLKQVGAFPHEGGTLYLGLLPHRPYPAEFSVCSHYPGYQRLYGVLRQLEGEKRASGVGARAMPDIAYKPLAASLGYGWLGKQSLLHHPVLGSYVSIHAIWVGKKGEYSPPMPPLSAPCGDCDRCQRVCPTGAVLGNGSILRERCLRHWMLSGQPVPPELRPLMGHRLLGCDLCQRACPHNPVTADEPPETLRLAVKLSAILENPSASAKTLAPLLGTNLMRPRRLLAQALLCAGNSGRTSLAPLAAAWKNDPDPVVSDHAQWAWERLYHAGE